jgi:hypothetical protein
MSTPDTDQTRAAEDWRYRDLWGAVVLQAKEDIENAQLDSIEFTQAVAFFISSGEWAKNRTAIGDFLDLHRDDLEKLGRRCINERRVSEGFEPLRPRQPRPMPARTTRTVDHQPQPQSAPPPPHSRQPKPARVNPFFPRGIYASLMSRDRAA